MNKVAEATGPLGHVLLSTDPGKAASSESADSSTPAFGSIVDAVLTSGTGESPAMQAPQTKPAPDGSTGSTVLLGRQPHRGMPEVLWSNALTASRAAEAAAPGGEADVHSNSIEVTTSGAGSCKKNGRQTTSLGGEPADTCPPLAVPEALAQLFVAGGLQEICLTDQTAIPGSQSDSPTQPALGQAPVIPVTSSGDGRNTTDEQGITGASPQPVSPGVRPNEKMEFIQTDGTSAGQRAVNPRMKAASSLVPDATPTGTTPPAAPGPAADGKGEIVPEDGSALDRARAAGATVSIAHGDDAPALPSPAASPHEKKEFFVQTKGSSAGQRAIAPSMKAASSLVADAASTGTTLPAVQAPPTSSKAELVPEDAFALERARAADASVSPTRGSDATALPSPAVSPNDKKELIQTDRTPAGQRAITPWMKTPSPLVPDATSTGTTQPAAQGLPAGSKPRIVAGGSFAVDRDAVPEASVSPTRGNAAPTLSSPAVAPNEKKELIQTDVNPAGQRAITARVKAASVFVAEAKPAGATQPAVRGPELGSEAKVVPAGASAQTPRGLDASLPAEPSELPSDRRVALIEPLPIPEWPTPSRAVEPGGRRIVPDRRANTRANAPELTVAPAEPQPSRIASIVNDGHAAKVPVAAAILDVAGKGSLDAFEDTIPVAFDGQTPSQATLRPAGEIIARSTPATTCETRPSSPDRMESRLAPDHTVVAKPQIAPATPGRLESAEEPHPAEPISGLEMEASRPSPTAGTPSLPDPNERRAVRSTPAARPPLAISMPFMKASSSGEAKMARDPALPAGNKVRVLAEAYRDGQVSLSLRRSESAAVDLGPAAVSGRGSEWRGGDQKAEVDGTRSPGRGDQKVDEDMSVDARQPASEHTSRGEAPGPEVERQSVRPTLAEPEGEDSRLEPHGRQPAPGQRNMPAAEIPLNGSSVAAMALPRGTPAAENLHQMKFAAAKHEFAPSPEKELPGRSIVAEELDAAGGFGGSTSTAAVGELPRPDSPAWVATLSGVTLETRVADKGPAESGGYHSSSHERLLRDIENQVQWINSSKADRLSVVLRPDGKNSVLLQLHTHAGCVEAQVRCDRNDFAALNGHWGELQEALSASGVRLAPLTAISDDWSESMTSLPDRYDQPASSHHEGQERSPNTPDRYEKKAEEPLPDPSPSVRSRIRPRGLQRLLESWA